MTFRSLFSIQRKLALFVSCSILLVLWLSISFWVQAYIEREDAKNIQKSSVQESQLFDLSIHLSRERSLAYRMISGEASDTRTINQYKQSLVITEKKIQQIETAISRDGPNDSHDEYHDHAAHNMDSRLEKMVTLRNEIEALQPIFHAQIALPKEARDHGFKMELFHGYGSLIQEMSEVRQGIHFVPRFTNQDVLFYSELTNSLWKLNESTRQVESLLEGVLLDRPASTTHDTNHHANMIYGLKTQLELTLKDIARHRAQNHINPQLAKQMDQVVDLYNDTYKKLASDSLSSLRETSVDDNALQAWRALTTLLGKRVERLASTVAKDMLEKVRQVERGALKNIVIDTFLVLLCIGMAVASLLFFKKIHSQAHHDELTGLPNRRLFTIAISKIIEDARHNGNCVSLLTVDLDRFKIINDSMGHAIGDKLLVLVARRLEEVGNTAIVARMGGDEFSVLLATRDSSGVLEVAQRVHQTLNDPFMVDGGTLHIGGSVGICSYPEDVDSAESLQKASDLAMYSAKNRGRNLIVQYDSTMGADHDLRLTTERELQSAISLNQFELHFQPQFNFSENMVDAVEALIRWNHPTRGMVPPDQFIPIAEECGFLPDLGDWVLDEACRNASQWARVHGVQLRVAVNVSTEQFLEADFVMKVLDCLQRHQLEPKSLELEVTESVVMADIDAVVTALEQLRNVGIKIALDDFGTGYSSLSYLQNLPLDTLKIDKSFVQKIELDSAPYNSITETITVLARTLGLETVAEGVETQSQLTRISELGIDVVQGYFYSKPVAASQILSVVKKINSPDDQSSKAA